MKIQAFQKTIIILENAFNQLEKQIGDKPCLVKVSTYNVMRCKNRTFEAAIIQKAARLISGLNASIILLQSGYIQEIGVITRTLAEFTEDIFFLCQALEKEPTELHKEYLEIFFQEEFDFKRIPYSEKRATVPRKKIQAALAPELDKANPSDMQAIMNALYKGPSGYVHGASKDILEMYGGNPPSYHLRGLLGTPRIPVWENYLANYFHRGINTFARIAFVLKQSELRNELITFRHEFEAACGMTFLPNKDGRKEKRNVS
jgi:Family of unknown function (DUF5677)